MWLSGDAGGGSNLLITLLPFILMFAIFYFLLIRPQQKKQRSRGAMLNALSKGDKVVTIGGLHGTIDAVDDATVFLKCSDGSRLQFERAAVGRVLDN